MPMDNFFGYKELTMVNTEIGANAHLTVPHWALPNSLRSITSEVMTGKGFNLALAPVPTEH
ncbi:hypothetical protein BWK47_12920 [Synechocystis sp. CACIAM 05]|nr:hypothetical protein BWK47_12920 [Synechocystis sp. CACIAM 05]